MALIELENVSLTFRVHTRDLRTLKDFLLGRILRHGSATHITVHALRDITLTISEGEQVGIIGSNGAGKSSLLKLLAGIYPPTAGRRHVEGRVCALFDIMLGFESNATGWENIAYRGYLQGETPKSIRAKKSAIAEFSELGRFLNMPVRYYSSGMLVRLAFSIATAIDPEILIIDEVLSAGDAAFQVKARKRMEEMMAKARVMVVVSHDLASLQRLCTRTIWLSGGQIRFSGRTDAAIAAYQSAVGVSTYAA
jgi:ABC-type polysaccharide/polyol phosphate transport system ATPase subunit